MPERDTIPAPPVPSGNPIAIERKFAQYAIVETGTVDWWVGVKIDTNLGVARWATPVLDFPTAVLWLARMRRHLTQGTVEPTFCSVGHLKDTPSVCGACLKGGRS